MTRTALERWSAFQECSDYDPTILVQRIAEALAQDVRRLTVERDEATAKERAAVVAWLRLHDRIVEAANIDAGAHLVSP